MSKTLREIATEAAARDRNGGTSTGDWSPMDRSDLDRCVDLAFIRGYIAGHDNCELAVSKRDIEYGRKAGLEEAADMLVKRGRAYAEDSVLRHPGVILESFAIQVLALIPASECTPPRKEPKDGC